MTDPIGADLNAGALIAAGPAVLCGTQQSIAWAAADPWGAINAGLVVSACCPARAAVVGVSNDPGRTDLYSTEVGFRV